MNTDTFYNKTLKEIRDFVECQIRNEKIWSTASKEDLRAELHKLHVFIKMRTK